MVLETPSNEPAFSSTDDVPHSDRSMDDGGFDSPGGPDSRYKIDGEGLPRSLPIVGSLFGFGDARRNKFIGLQLKQAQTLLGRRLQQPEVDAIAHWASVEVRTLSYGAPLGLAAGVWRARKTADTWKLPMWKMGPNFDPSVVRFGPVALLQGDLAKTFWRIVRFSSYGAVGSIVGFMLVTPYATTKGGVGMYQDHRLKDWVEALQEKSKNRRRPDVNITERQQSELPNANSPFGRRRAINQPGAQQEPAKPVVDDASPSGGRGLDDDYSFFDPSTPSQSEDAFSATPYQRDGQADSAQTRTGYTRPSTRPNQAPQASQFPSAQEDAYSGSSSTSSSSFDYFGSNDEGSPSASSSGASTTNTAEGGSVWERLRRNAGSAQGAPRPTEKSNGGRAPESVDSRGNNYSFPGEDMDRQSARDVAQRDFDQKIERERRGEDFGGGRRF